MFKHSSLSIVTSTVDLSAGYDEHPGCSYRWILRLPLDVCVEKLDILLMWHSAVADCDSPFCFWLSARFLQGTESNQACYQLRMASCCRQGHTLAFRNNSNKQIWTAVFCSDVSTVRIISLEKDFILSAQRRYTDVLIFLALGSGRTFGSLAALAARHVQLLHCIGPQSELINHTIKAYLIQEEHVSTHVSQSKHGGLYYRF